MDGYSLYICLGILAQILLSRSSPPALRVSYKNKNPRHLYRRRFFSSQTKSGGDLIIQFARFVQLETNLRAVFRAVLKLIKCITLFTRRR